MNKGVIYFTKVPEKYAGKHLEHMIGEKLLEAGMKKEYGICLKYEPRSEGDHGKPFFALRADIHYNISHSGEYVMCLLADQEVGIDVQIHRQAHYEKMLRRMVPQEEIDDILTADNVEQAFFIQWVLREAYIKWTGQGLSRDLRTIDMKQGVYTLLDIQEGYSGAVWSRKPMELRWEYVETDLEQWY